MQLLLCKGPANALQKPVLPSAPSSSFPVLLPPGHPSPKCSPRHASCSKLNLPCVECGDRQVTGWEVEMRWRLFSLPRVMPQKLTSLQPMAATRGPRRPAGDRCRVGRLATACTSSANSDSDTVSRLAPVSQAVQAAQHSSCGAWAQL